MGKGKQVSPRFFLDEGSLCQGSVHFIVGLEGREVQLFQLDFHKLEWGQVTLYIVYLALVKTGFI